MLVVGAIQYLLPAPAPVIKITLSLLFVYVFNYIAFKGMKAMSQEVKAPDKEVNRACKRLKVICKHPKSPAQRVWLAFTRP